MVRSLKLSLQKGFGFLTLFAGIFVLVVGVAMMFDDDPVHSETGRGVAMFSTSILAPGAVLLYFFRRARRRLERLESIASVVKSYRRITVADLAGKIGVSIPEASELLAHAIAEGRIAGNFDRTTDEFFTEEARCQDVKFKFCPSCGAPLGRIFLEGETVKCDRCGFLM